MDVEEDELSLLVESLERVRLVIRASDFRKLVENYSGFFTVKSFSHFFRIGIFLRFHSFVSFGKCLSHRRYKFSRGL